MEYDMQKFTNKVENITHFIGRIVYSDLYSNNESNLEGLKKYLYTLLFKTNNGLCSANLLFCNLEGRAYYTDSAFLILRTILSDYIIYMHLLLESNHDDEEFLKNIKSLEFDHIKKEIENTKSIYRHIYRMSQQEVEFAIQKLKDDHKEFFDDSGNPLYQQIKPSVNYAIKTTNNYKDKTYLDLLRPAFDLYNLFSKYEHFGYYTFGLVHRQFDKGCRDRIFKEYFDSTEIIIIFISGLLRGWYKPESDIYKKFLSYRGELQDIEDFKLPTKIGKK